MQISTQCTHASGRIFNAASNTAPLSMLVPGLNPRQYFDEVEMEELRESIRAQGVLQPVLVRINEKDELEIVAGGRRFRAAKDVLGVDYEMPIMLKPMSQDEADAAAVIENSARANVAPTEEAHNAAKLLQRFSGDREETAKYLGWSRTVLDNRLALLALSSTGIQALNERRIPLGIAELLATITRENQDKALPIILANKLSISDVKALILKKSKLMAAAIFNKAECGVCPHNSDLQSTLFAENLGTGSCSNATCFDHKTEEELENRKVALADEYPQVRFVRPGDNFTVIRLVADGTAGVGPEQAEACKSCANYGGAISAMPDSLGKAFKGQCFDPSCNKEKVASYAQSLLPPPVEVVAAPPNADAGTKATSNAAKSAPAVAAKVQATTVTESQRVKDYREAIWRTAIKKDLAHQPAKSMLLLFGLAASSQISTVSSAKIFSAIEKMSGTKLGAQKSIMEICTAASTLSEEERNKVLNGLTMSACDTMPINYLQQMMTFLDVDMAKHWKIDTDFFKMLTKSEIEVVAANIGLKKHLDKTFSSLMSKSKDDFIKQLLNSGFAFEGVVPKIMHYAKK